MSSLLKSAYNLITKYKIICVTSACLFIIAGLLFFFVIPYLVISPSDKYVLNVGDSSSIKVKNAKVGLVLGAGIKNGKPYDELQARLDSAADALNKGYVDKLLLSGDNRFEHYDEPTAMKNYLVKERRIPESKLQTDFAGRSTYESCERAAKVFGQDNKNMIIFSAGSHLPRAIYLCRKFNIHAYGIANNIEASNAGYREVFARTKAVLNVYIKGEPTVLGSSIKI
jgi:vancomycin permeability regulator SanA